MSAICLLAWLNLQVCIWFLAALLFHELGHLLVMKLCGVPVLRISFRISGAVIDSGFCSYRQEAICAAAGPASSFLLTLVFCRGVSTLAVVSLLLGCVNLLPIYPLDGGRILRALLLLRMEEEKARGILRAVTFAVCCLLMLGACWVTVEKQAGLWPIFASLVILCRVGSAGWQENENPVAFPGEKS